MDFVIVKAIKSEFGYAGTIYPKLRHTIRLLFHDFKEGN